jgi:hypothetical protein
MPRPLNVSPLRSGRGDGRGSHCACSAAALTTRDVAGRLQIAQAECERISAARGGDLVDKGFAGELDLRAHRIAQMRGDTRHRQPPR